MADEHNSLSPAEAQKQRQSIALKLLELTRQAALLVDLEQLEPVLERKTTLMKAYEEMNALAPAATGAEAQMLERTLLAIGENESALEARLSEATEAVRKELKELDRSSRVRQYLAPGEKKPKRKGERVNVKH